MASAIQTGWSKPSTILFASEIPANDKAFSFALAQASEFGADLILFHAYDTLVVAASETSGIRYYDYAAAAKAEIKSLEPLALQARQTGIRCEIVVRPGLPAEQILAFLRERSIDRVVMGAHSPGPIREASGRLGSRRQSFVLLRCPCTSLAPKPLRATTATSQPAQSSVR